MTKPAFYTSSYKNTQGFSLIEVAITLAILGILGGLSLPLITKYATSSRIIETKNRQEQIVNALGAYALRYGALPCPSPDDKGTWSTKCTQPGFLPYQALGLPSSLIKDGFNRPFTYAVEPALGITRWGGANDFCGKVSPQLKVLDDQGQSLGGLPGGSSATNSFIGAVIISHGEKGKNSSSPGKSENTNGDLIFADHPYSINPQAPFDDIVKWITRDNLMSMVAKKPCGSAP